MSHHDAASPGPAAAGLSPGPGPGQVSVLVIEDEPDLQQVLEYNLTRAGYAVRQALRGQDGLRLAQSEPPGLVLLDLMLPDLPGTKVCQALKGDPRTRDVPVVMLTARGEEIDRVLGFELGADDYVVKPFSLRELLLRIQALLRRAAPPDRPDRLGDPGESGERSEELRCGRIRIDRAAHRAFVDEHEVKLTALEFKLLTTLCRSQGKVLSRAALLDEVWNIEAEITTRTVDTHVKRLREKIGPAGEYIQTVRGVGYRLTVAAPGDDAP